jgi:ribonuclease Z
MIRVTFLGTSASRPTVGRNVSAVAIQREGVTLLFDCGEGTQRQMMRYGTGFAVDHIFISHVHADHYLGVIGLLRTLSLQGRTETLHLYGPAGSRKVLEIAIELGGNRMSFAVETRELSPGDAVDWDDFAVEAVAVRHGVPAVGYALRERPRAGRFNVEAARALGIPEGPLFGRLHRGETIEWGGRRIEPAEVVGGARPGRLIVFTGDTRPADAIAERARGADLLIHDCTFGDEGVDRARETFHSTAREAAEIAARAGVKRLYLTHVSARYSANADPLLREAREVFRDAEVAFDGLTVEIEYPEDDGGSESA